MVIFNSYVKLPEGAQDEAEWVGGIASDVLAAHINIYIYQYLWFQYQLPLDVIPAEGCIWTHAVPSVGAMAQSTTWWVGLRT